MKRIFIAIVLSMTACTTVENEILKYVPPVFPEQEELTYTVVARDIPVKYVMKMTILDSVLIVKGNDGENFFFAYNKNTGKHLMNFLKIGRGPFEGMVPNMLAANGDSCIVTEANLRKGWTFSLSGLLAGRENFYREFRFKWPEDRTRMMAREIVNLGDDRYIFNVHFSSKERFALIANPYSSGERETKHLYRQYPKVTPDADSVNAAVLNYVNTFAVSPDRTRFVSLSYIGAVAETFEFKGDTLIPLAVKGFLKPEYNTIEHGNVFPTNETLIGFGSVIATDKGFYAIYCGDRYDSVTDMRTIVSFDWKINPIKQYTVKDRILEVVLDPETKDVYGIVRDTETSELNIVKFDKRFIE